MSAGDLILGAGAVVVTAGLFILGAVLFVPKWERKHGRRFLP